jgi:hypothetical protein
LGQINKILKALNYSFEHGIKLKFRKSIHSIESMALQGLRRQRNSTKKNRRPIFRVIATYRLCNSVADLKHSKNLYRRQSETILCNAEIIFVGELRQESSFSHQICAPCERRLNNAIQFRKLEHLLRSRSQSSCSWDFASSKYASIDFTLEDETLTVLASLRLYYQE